jgi:hypothetical protein
MNTATARKLFITLATATAVSLPVHCQAATAVLPWDRTLTVMQDMLIDTVAPASIALAFTGAVIFLRARRVRQTGRSFSRIRDWRLHRARCCSPAELRPTLTQFQSIKTPQLGDSQ